MVNASFRLQDNEGPAYFFFLKFCFKENVCCKNVLNCKYVHTFNLCKHKGGATIEQLPNPNENMEGEKAKKKKDTSETTKGIIININIRR